MIKILFLFIIIILFIIFFVFFKYFRKTPSLLSEDLINIISGNKRSGKSTTAAALAYECHQKKIPVYSNYAIKYSQKLPTIKDSHGWEVLDKDSLYDMAIYNSVLIIDEASSIWFSRNFSKFNEVDNHFFNFLGHRHLQVYIISQYWDLLDLNIRRGAGTLYFVRKGRFGFSTIEISDVDQDKVRCLDESVDRKGYDVFEFKTIMCDKPFKKRIWRPRWYNNFNSYCLDKEYKDFYCLPWEKLHNFPNNTKWWQKFLKY